MPSLRLCKVPLNILVYIYILRTYLLSQAVLGLILIDTGVEKNKIAEMITIYNKIDLKGLENSYQYNKNYISALTGEGVSDLKKTLKNLLI